MTNFMEFMLSLLSYSISDLVLLTLQIWIMSSSSMEIFGKSSTKLSISWRREAVKVYSVFVGRFLLLILKNVLCLITLKLQFCLNSIFFNLHNFFRVDCLFEIESK